MAKESAQLLSRPPVVVVVGHVDHGKTTLLDYIRKANVAEREAGGITQSVGAYEIAHGGKKITFIDTPGHEAFAAMRARGAAAADLAILVVAADEGVKPQTKEALATLEKSETPFIVALTKTDKPGANVDRMKNELASAGVLLEGYGGQVSWHAVSAKTGEGVNDLLDLILLAAEVEHLTYDPAAPVSGYVLEARMDKRRGIEATLIVRNGILRRGADIATPTSGGKAKILEDFLGKPAAELAPSAPARVVGFTILPKVGEEFAAGKPAAKEAVRPAAKKSAPGGVPAPAEETKRLRLVLKAKDAGSLEALSLIIRALKAPEGGDVLVFSESVGDITDGDVKDAIAARATVIGFGVKAEKNARALAETHGVRLIASEIIYDLVSAVEEFVRGLGKPAVVGVLEVLALFGDRKGSRQLVGGRVVEGALKNKASFEIVRGAPGAEQAAGTGKVANLRDKKNDIPQAERGKEAGVLAETTVPIEKGDRLVVREARA